MIYSMKLANAVVYNDVGSGDEEIWPSVSAAAIATTIVLLFEKVL